MSATTTTKRPLGPRRKAAIPPAKPTTAREAEAAGRQAYEDDAAGKRPSRPLTPIQALLADELGDLLARGGACEEISNMLWAALGNLNRRTWSELEEDPFKVEAHVRDHTKAGVTRVKVELEAEWRRNRRAEAEQTVEPQALSARIRAGVIDQLRDNFRWFVGNATAEEHHVLLGIFIDHMSLNRGRLSQDEMPLALAMNERLAGVTREFIRVPPRMREQVERYIDCLLAAERPAA